MKQSFKNKNLSGSDFSGSDLSGSDLSGSNIRSSKFTSVILKDANFTGAKAGLEFRWVIIFIIASLVLSTFSALITAVAAAFAADLYYLRLKDSFTHFFPGIVIPAAIGTIYAVTLRYGLVEALFTVICICIIPGTVGWMIFVYAQGILKGISSFLVILAWAGTGAFFEVVFSSLSGIIFGAVVNIPFASIVGSTFGLIVLFQVAALNWENLFESRPIEIDWVVIIEFWAIGIVVAGSVIGSYISYLSLYKNNYKYAFIRKLAVIFATMRGTSFHNADLTNTRFTGATLKNADFREAILIRTCFRNANKLDQVRPGSTYLKNTLVCQLLFTGKGEKKNFDNLPLRGINLQEAKLQGATFIGADLSEACLQDANLSGATLKQTKFDATDFTGATLTGAYMENSGITSSTKFDKVKCKYVYMRVPTEEEKPDRWRKPDNKQEEFADGEFDDFIKPIVDTLDLYHNQGVDPRAIAISFKELAENNPDAELEIVAMEKRGEDKFLLRAKTAPDADKSELSAEYFETYNQVKGLKKRELKLLLAEKNNQIHRLENMVMTALERPSFYSNTQIEEVGNMTNNPGGFSVGGSVSGDIKNLQGDNNRAVQGDNNQVIQGDGNQVGVDTEAPLSKNDIVKLLEELEALVLKAELPEETKEEVSEEISAAKKATDKEEPKKNIAIANLESVAQTLEKTNKTVDASQKLWNKAKPIIVKIASWLGAAAGSYLLKL
ncbi:MAG: pentapeptide repeat-containing protein [Cyanobacteria bacterium P01_H01_bin.150]